MKAVIVSPYRTILKKSEPVPEAGERWLELWRQRFDEPTRLALPEIEAEVDAWVGKRRSPAATEGLPEQKRMELQDALKERREVLE